MIDLASLDYLAIVLAAVLAYGLGALWYSPMAFFGPWLAALGRNPATLGNPLPPMLVTAATTLATAAALAVVLQKAGIATWSGGGLAGLIVGLGIVATSIVSDHAFTNRPLVLTLIVAGHRVAALVVMGLVLGAW